MALEVFMENGFRVDGRRMPPPPSGLWATLIHRASEMARRDGRWEAPIQVVLEAADKHLAGASMNLRETCLRRGWTDSESFLLGWARDHRLEVTWNTVSGVLTLTPRKKKSKCQKAGSIPSAQGAVQSPLPGLEE
jgi:hypothetical protein